MNMTDAAPLPPILLAVRYFFLAAFLLMIVVYVLRMTGHLKSPHQDKTTDASHLIMAAAMFGMILWPNVF